MGLELLDQGGAAPTRPPTPPAPPGPASAGNLRIFSSMSKGVAVNQRGSGQRALENVADSSPSSANDVITPVDSRNCDQHCYREQRSVYGFPRRHRETKTECGRKRSCHMGTRKHAGVDAVVPKDPQVEASKDRAVRREIQAVRDYSWRFRRPERELCLTQQYAE